MCKVKNLLYTTKEKPWPITCVYKKTIDSPENYRMHLNNMCEIYIFVDGKADYLVENRCFQIDSYDVVILNPYEPHMPLLKDYDWYERFYFLVPLTAFEHMENDPLRLLTQENTKGNNYISLPLDKKERLKEYLEIFKEEEISPHQDPVWEMRAMSAFFGILGLLNENVLSTWLHTRPRETINMPPIIFGVLKYIDEHISTSFSEKDIADEFHISVPYLSRIFKNSINVGLKKYILLCKIGNAKRMLDEGQSVTDTCFACGFNDCSYFIKVFKTYAGITPYQYHANGQRQIK